MAQLVQVFGALFVLTAFAALQFGRMRAESRIYLWFNFIGSSILTALAILEGQIGFLLLEGVWALVSAWGLVQVARGRPPGPAH